MLMLDYNMSLFSKVWCLIWKVLCDKFMQAWAVDKTSVFTSAIHAAVGVKHCMHRVDPIEQ